MMINKTPLRLVGLGEPAVSDDHVRLGERPRADERPRIAERPRTADLGGAPMVQVSDEEATTRKVPDAAMIAARDALADPPRKRPHWHKLVPAGAVAAMIIVLIVALTTGGKSSPAPASATVPKTMERERAQPTPAPVPPGVAPVANLAAPEMIRVRIAAAPVEAVLSLDGNVIAGHRLDLEVPKDPAVHVVRASAPGYAPFVQQVSFGSDVVLAINLRRGRGALARTAVYARPSQPEARSKGEARAPVLPSSPRVEPGMNLEAPPRRAGAKVIDERNPYKP